MKWWKLAGDQFTPRLQNMAQSNNSILCKYTKRKKKFYENVKYKKILNAQPYQFKDNSNTTEKYIVIENDKQANYR